MNEQIKQLAIRAGAEHFIGDNAHLPIGRLDKEGIEKFAELIVRECFEHCKGQLVDKKTAEHMGLTYNDAVGDCANGLLQHFGVEE